MTEFICLAAIGAIDFVPVLVFLWREGLVIAAQHVASDTGAPVRYNRIGGKLKGATQGACILWLSATVTVPSIPEATGQWPSGLFVWLAVTVTVLSGIDYLLAHRGALRASVASRDGATR